MKKKKITELWAFISLAPDGDEGVCCFSAGPMVYPMVAADQERVDQLRPIAQRLANESGTKIQLRRFRNLVKEESFAPHKKKETDANNGT